MKPDSKEILAEMISRINQGEFLKFAAAITKANPAKIAKEAVQLIKDTLSQEI